MTTDWVDCPLCEGTDMRRECDEEGYCLIFCVNHSCPSNVVLDKPDLSGLSPVEAYLAAKPGARLRAFFEAMSA